MTDAQAHTVFFVSQTLRAALHLRACLWRALYTHRIEDWDIQSLQPVRLAVIAVGIGLSHRLAQVAFKSSTGSTTRAQYGVIPQGGAVFQHPLGRLASALLESAHSDSPALTSLPEDSLACVGRGLLLRCM